VEKDSAGRISTRALMLPRLYAILDAEVLVCQKMEIGLAAKQLRDAGVTLVQYRDKTGTPEQVLRNAKIIGDVFSGVDGMLVLNDDPALAVLSGWNAVHVGQGDAAVDEARKILLPGGLADYVAIGPVFATGTKADADPVVGLEGVRRARALTSRPLVAIGGITLANASSVIAAGADSVAVISALFTGPGTVGDVVCGFRRILGDR